MKVGKPKSKRVSVRLRHKIEKASSAKQRKDRKQAKKNPEWRSRLKKDPGIPNLFPYKAKLLAEIEENKNRKEVEKLQKQENAKARREGRAVTDVSATAQTAEEDDELLDDEDEDDGEELDGDEDMDVDESNPMAALLASAQARANAHVEDDTHEVISAVAKTQQSNNKADKSEVTKVAEQHVKKILPKQAREDPVKTVSLLLDQMQVTEGGIDTIVQYYEIPPLATAGSDITTRLLVEVARKRGRLGKGGIPNLHAAALLMLNDINDERLHLPSLENKQKTAVASSGGVSIVKTMAAPFRLEGLWGGADSTERAGSEMAVDG